MKHLTAKRVPMLLIIAVLAFAQIGAAAKVKLKVATHINDAALVEEQSARMRGFEKVRPDVEVEVWHVAWNDYHDQLLTMFLGGVGPDSVTIGRLQLASFAESGLIQPIDNLIAADKSFNLRRDVIPALMTSGIYKGRHYGFPIYNGPALLFFNPETFEQRGVATPIQYIAENRWNRDTFLQAAKKLTFGSTGSGVPTHKGYEGYGTWEPGWLTYVRNGGGDVIGPNGQSVLDDPRVIESLEWLNNLNLQHGVMRSPGPGGDKWETGAVAMSAQWQTNGMIQRSLFTTFKPEPALIPAGPAGYAHIAGGVPVCVSAATKYPEIAYEYAKWFGTDSGIWQIRGGVPLSWKELRSREYRQNVEVFDHPEMFELALTVGDIRPEAAFGLVKHAEVNKVLIDTLINPIRQGRASVRAAVTEAHRLISQSLAR